MLRRHRIQVVLLAALSFAATPNARAAGPYQFYSLQPCRILDTRPYPLNAGPRYDFAINGICGIPSDAAAVALNITLVGPTAGGFLVLWPYNTAAPTSSNINADAGEPAIANGAIVPLTLGSPNISLSYGTAGGGTANVILDVSGYFR